MLDNLRDQPEASFFQEEEESAPEVPVQEPGEPRPRRTFDQVTGTNAFQRFVLALMFLLTICLLGSMLLILTGKVIPSFLY
jgi:hypothetical protein